MLCVLCCTILIDIYGICQSKWYKIIYNVCFKTNTTVKFSFLNNSFNNQTANMQDGCEILFQFKINWIFIIISPVFRVNMILYTYFDDQETFQSVILYTI